MPQKGRLKTDSFWYRYIYPKNLTLFCKEKLVAPEISLGGNFSYDEKGEFYSTTTIYGYVKKEAVLVSYKSLMAILNSKLCWWYLMNTGTVLANGYFRYKPNYINPFPFPIITKEASEKLDKLVNEIYTSRQNKANSNVPQLEKKIDFIVYKLYNLTLEEIELINNN